MPVYKYLLSIILYSINVQHHMSVYFPIREYSDICTIVQQINWNLYKNATNIFNMCASVSIDTKIYECKICAYDIEYLSCA